jgi:hypothetical protein
VENEEETWIFSGIVWELGKDVFGTREKRPAWDFDAVCNF